MSEIKGITQTTVIVNEIDYEVVKVGTHVDFKVFEIVDGKTEFKETRTGFIDTVFSNFVRVTSSQGQSVKTTFFTADQFADGIVWIKEGEQ